MPTSTLMPGKEFPSNQVNIGGGQPGPYLQSGSKVGPETVRATGSSTQGDAGWRQNLATFSGGQFARPGGSLNFNPLSNSPFGGQATGGGNAPAMGMPSTLLQYALGMNPMTMTTQNPQPQSQSPTPSGQSNIVGIDDWLSRYMAQGANFGIPT